MTTPGQFTLRRIHAMLWTGTNGTDIAGLYTSLDTDPGTYSVVSEVAGDRLTLRSSLAATGRVLGERTVFADRPWVVIDQTSGVIANVSEAAYLTRFVRGSEAGALITGGSEPYFGEGLAVSASSIGIGATVTIDVPVSPPVPPTYLTTAVLRCQVLAATGVNLSTISVAATPTIQTAFVPSTVVAGVIVPSYTLVRTKIKNSGISILSSVQVKATAYTTALV